MNNGTFGSKSLDFFLIDDNLASVPDINQTGSEFYTFYFRTELDLQEADGPTFLFFRGINYRATVFVDGSELTPLEHGSRTSSESSPGDDVDAVGMFHRWTYLLPSSAAGHNTSGLAVLVRPPDYPVRNV